MWSIIPHEPVQDTLAILIILLNIPPLLSILVQLLYIQTSSSKQVISIFLFRSSRTVANTITASQAISNGHSSKNRDKDALLGNGNGTGQEQTEESENFITPLLFITAIDLTLSLLFKLIIPNFNKLILLLANSIIAVSLSGFSYQQAFLGSLVVISLDFILKVIASYLAKRFSLFTVSYHVFPLISNPNPIGLYRQVVHFINLYLAIHILLTAFCSVFRRNYIAKQLHYLTNQNSESQLLPPTPPVSLINNPQSNNVPEVEVPIDIAKSLIPHYISNHNTNNIYPNLDTNSHQTEAKSETDTEVKIPEPSSELPHDNHHDNHHDDTNHSPASYPQKNTVNPVSTSQIVSENFSTFVNSSFLKSKNPAKSSQPLWSLIGTVRAMSARSDIYSGEVNLNDSSQEHALVLNENLDYIKLSKGDGRCIGTFYVIYVGETILAFLLNKKKQYASVIPNIITKVNGLIWYQISRAALDEYEELYLVSGLTPLSHYDIQFILQVNDGSNILMDEFIIGTVDGEKIPVETSSTETNFTSPIITLQESLITTTENLVKERLKYKKQRKEIAKSLGSLRSDIEKNREKITQGGQTETSKRRLDQLRNQLATIESEAAVIEAEYLSLEEDEQNQTDIYNAEKPKYDVNLRSYQTFCASFNERIAEKQNTEKKLETELESLQTKLTKSQTRLEKTKAEYAKLSQEIDELISNDIQNKIALREGRNFKRSLLLDEFKKEINVLERGLNSLNSENEALRVAVVSAVNGSNSGVGSSAVSINGAVNGNGTK